MPGQSSQPEKPEQETPSAPPTPAVSPPPVEQPLGAEISDHEFTMTEVGDELDELPEE
jgi:hypothetical protein